MTTSVTIELTDSEVTEVRDIEGVVVAIDGDAAWVRDDLGVRYDVAVAVLERV